MHITMLTGFAAVVLVALFVYLVVGAAEVLGIAIGFAGGTLGQAMSLLLSYRREPTD